MSRLSSMLVRPNCRWHLLSTNFGPIYQPRYWCSSSRQTPWACCVSCGFPLLPFTPILLASRLPR
eukprot:12662221-Prorocentrum_lima.AAC.1